MGDTMQIHLSKPGGQREGPYTLEQIIQGLASKKYRDTDYWAWHEGLAEWVPLYALPGVPAAANSAPPAAAAPQPNEAATPAKPDGASPDAAAAMVSVVPPRAHPQPAPTKAAATAASVAPVVARPEPEAAVPLSEPREASPETAAAAATGASGPTAAEPEEGLTAASHQVSSGMAASALEQVFMFTSGDGPSAWQSPTVTRMLQAIIGEDPGALRQDVPRDVVARCAVSELLKPDGSNSEAVWRAMAIHRPAIVQQARERLYRICVRTFRIEADAVVALVLFYNKQKL